LVDVETDMAVTDDKSYYAALAEELVPLPDREHAGAHRG
jgi:hypothetical protein